MSWCDKLASTPTVGLKFSGHYRSGASILDALSPLLSEWGKTSTEPFSMAKQEAFAIELTTEDGFHYGVDPSRIFVDFRHRLKVKSVSAGPPIVEMLSSPRPYTELLPEVGKRALAVADLIIDPKGRHLERVGIVSTTAVAENDAPPGILRFIKYMKQPWGGESPHYDVQILGHVTENAQWSDRCLHQFSQNEESQGLITIKFDWQRIYKEPKSIGQLSSLKTAVQFAQDAAINYFEELAQGDRFDGNIYSKKTD